MGAPVMRPPPTGAPPAGMPQPGGPPAFARPGMPPPQQMPRPGGPPPMGFRPPQGERTLLPKQPVEETRQPLQEIGQLVGDLGLDYPERMLLGFLFGDECVHLPFRNDRGPPHS